MNSKIRVSYDYDKKEPFLSIRLSETTEDLADGHLKHLLERINSDGLRLHYPERSPDPSTPINSAPEIRIGNRYLLPFAGIRILQYLLEKGIAHTQHSDCVEVDQHVDLFNLGFHFAVWQQERYPEDEVKVTE